MNISFQEKSKIVKKNIRNTTIVRISQKSRNGNGFLDHKPIALDYIYTPHLNFLNKYKMRVDVYLLTFLKSYDKQRLVEIELRDLLHLNQSSIGL